MYGIYGDIIAAAQKATEPFDETAELLQYPEVQADKAYYLSVLERYNDLNAIQEKLTALKKALSDEEELTLLLGDAGGGEREELQREIAQLQRTASASAVALADLLGLRHVQERAYCRLKMVSAISKLGTVFYGQLKEYLLASGAKLEERASEHARGGALVDVSFFVEGEDLLARLSPLAGAHKVYLGGGRSEELCFGAALSGIPPTISENDIKIDVFHSSGAGGQNVNKVETAVRVTHLPSGMVATCQDERSQLKNKKRAIETLERRVRASFEAAEKKRVEAELYAQLTTKNTPITFDGENGKMTDTRLKAFTSVALPLTDFSAYINGLISLWK